MQRIELTNFMGPLHCPYCGQLVFRMDLDIDDEPITAPCPHTLFIASDDGIDHCSAKFTQLAHLPDDWDDDDLPDNGIDGLTNSVTAASTDAAPHPGRSGCSPHLVGVVRQGGPACAPTNSSAPASARRDSLDCDRPAGAGWMKLTRPRVGEVDLAAGARAKLDPDGRGGLAAAS